MIKKRSSKSGHRRYSKLVTETNARAASRGMIYGVGFKKGDFGEAESFYRQAISLPIYPDLSQEKQEFVVKTLTKLIDTFI